MPEAQSQTRQAKLDRVKRVVAVSSAKGGVGKSTVAVNLALALARSGAKVGLADVDIYGPSAPLMLGVTGRPKPVADNIIPPLRAHGIEVISMGFFLDDSAPVIWRGPMAMSATRQFLRGVDWGDLDWLIVDLPPGTGDIALTLAQEIPLDGAVIVSTPQDVAVADVKRGIAMFRKVNTPVLGVVQNMSMFVCPSCGTTDDLFGSRTGSELAAELGLPLLAEIPIEEAVRESGDAGTPIVVSNPKHPASLAFFDLARRVGEMTLSAADAKSAPEPVEVTHDTEGRIVHVTWSDGASTRYAMRGLRGWCPCAQCQGHSGERRFVDVKDPRVTAAEGVGRYAVRFIWDDGHATGMYSYPYLREIAEFPECIPA